VLTLPAQVASALEELKTALTQLYGERLRGVYLYGSYARGTATEDSDIDVMIVVEGDVNPTEEISRINDTVSDICLRYDVLIATFPVSEAWFQERASPLFINVRQEGVPV
jgi:predicted nucleotidyltransferase